MDNYVILGQYGDRILCLDGEKWKEIEGTRESMRFLHVEEFSL